MRVGDGGEGRAHLRYQIVRLRGAGTGAESGEGTPVLCASEIVETDRTVTDI